MLSYLAGCKEHDKYQWLSDRLLQDSTADEDEKR
jgi:hypothetical protein